MTKEIFSTLASGGQSYFHFTPTLAKGVKRNKIGPYFHDFSHKINWPYSCDKDNIPILDERSTNQYFSPIVTQMALGYYNAYILSKNTAFFSSFLHLANWLEKKIDHNGGIPTWDSFEKYDAFTQGMAISIFIRAFIETGEVKFKKAALSSFKILREGNNFGLRNEAGEIVILEEDPSQRFSAILNGWIYAIVGILELSYIDKSEVVKDELNIQRNSLEKLLPSFDTGFWSRYDLSGHIASFYYHNCHILMLKFLCMSFPDSIVIKKYYLKFKKYSQKLLPKTLALIIKIYQKIIDPTEHVI